MRLPTVALACGLVLGQALPVVAADDAKVKAATKQVETGAKKIGEGKIGQGVEETAKGIGGTVVEGAKFTGEKIKETGEKIGEKTKEASHAAEPKAKSAWGHVRDGAVDFGTSVKGFFSRLFGG
jgi:hypothetical protein